MSAKPEATTPENEDSDRGEGPRPPGPGQFKEEAWVRTQGPDLRPSHEATAVLSASPPLPRKAPDQKSALRARADFKPVILNNLPNVVRSSKQYVFSLIPGPNSRSNNIATRARPGAVPADGAPGSLPRRSHGSGSESRRCTALSSVAGAPSPTGVPGGAPRARAPFEANPGAIMLLSLSTLVIFAKSQFT
jgi:hypothetical protein